MNNYKLAMDNLDEEIVVDTTVLLRERKTELFKIVEAVDHLSKNLDWQVLKELVFDTLVAKVEKSLELESKKNELNTAEIYRLQGKLEAVKRYSDLYKLAESYKAEINQITKKLNDNANNI